MGGDPQLSKHGIREPDPTHLLEDPAAKFGRAGRSRLFRLSVHLNSWRGNRMSHSFPMGAGITSFSNITGCIIGACVFFGWR